ncbi:MAG TPA: 2-dehydropantoate 2-reductase, partial [Streptomyces sp.]|nr:2-dehydropantoate 2-reductase [Streptomyces sp.]
MSDHRPDLRALRAWIDDRQGAMLDDLGTYVRLESPSDDKPSLDRTLTWLRAWLDDRLGTPDAERHVPGGPHGDIVVRDHAGTGDAAAPDTPPVLLLCHYDTVWPLGTLDELPFAVTEEKV